MFLKLNIFFSVLLVANIVSNCNGVQPTNQLSRIAYGVDSSIEKHPHIVGVSSSLGPCGGSLISSTCVLTAAHCVHLNYLWWNKPAENLTIRGGTTIFGEGGYVQYVEKFRTPKNYNGISYDMDVAVIKLKQPMKGKNVKPIEIDFGHESISEGGLLNIAGWGKTGYPADEYGSKHLQEANVTILSREKCQIEADKWAKLFKPLYYFLGFNYKITENMLCSFAVDGGATCKGDSGGPMIHNGKQVGIVSWGPPVCRTATYPKVYANLKSREIQQFLNKTTQEFNCWD